MITTGPNYGMGSGGSSGGPTSTQYDYTDAEVGAYPWGETISGSTIGSKEDILISAERRSRNFYIATLGVLALIFLRGR